jgi:glutamate:GABA antiporter
MAATTDNSTILRSERIARGILPGVLNSFDMVAICVIVVLWIPNAAVMSGAGPAAYIYWILGFVTFLIPGAIVTGQLGLMFPGEGSIYVWTSKALGNFMGFLAGFCAWWPGMLSLISAGDAVVSLLQNLGNLTGVALLSDPGQQGLIIILVTTISFLLSIFRFRVTQNLVNVIFVSYGGAILLVGVAGILWLISGHQANTDLSLQSGHWGLSGSNFTFYGVVILALLGIEVPLNMGVEIKDMRSVTRYLLWGSIVVMVAYLLATFGIMVAVPLKDQSNPGAVVEAVEQGFGPVSKFLAIVVDLIFVGFFLFAATVFNYSFARLLFVSGLDRRLPAVVSKVNANKVPWMAVLVQSTIVALLVAIIFVIAPVALPTLSPDDIATIVYDILLAATTVIWCVSMVILFVDVVIIHRKHRDAFSRIHLAPDWVFYLCAVVGALASTFGIYVTFTAPWTTLVTSETWVIWITGLMLLSLLVAMAVYYIGQKTIESDVSDEEIIAEVTR